MTTATKPRAHYAAADVLELERRNDFGGRHGQAVQAFIDEAFFWLPVQPETKAYRLPGGGHTLDITEAIRQWGA